MPPTVEGYKRALKRALVTRACRCCSKEGSSNHAEPITSEGVWCLTDVSHRVLQVTHGSSCSGHAARHPSVSAPMTAQSPGIQALRQPWSGKSGMPHVRPAQIHVQDSGTECKLSSRPTAAQARGSTAIHNSTKSAPPCFPGGPACFGGAVPATCTLCSGATRRRLFVPGHD